MVWRKVLDQHWGAVSLGTLWFWWLHFVESFYLGGQWIDDEIVVGWSQYVRLLFVLGTVWDRSLWTVRY